MSNENIGFRGDNIIPAVYQNSLGYYELLKAFCDKLNEVIDVVNKGGGGGGGTGEDGATFIPYVSPEGIISWTNNKSLPNPEPVDIKGPAGADGTDGTDGTDGENGATFTPSVSSAGIISWTNDKELPNPQSVNLTLPLFNSMCSIISGNTISQNTTAGNFVYVTNSTIFARTDGFYILNTDKLINASVLTSELDTIQDSKVLNELVSIYSSLENNTLPLAGGTMTGAINMDGNKVSNLPTPTDNGDAVPKSYADGLLTGYRTAAAQDTIDAGKASADELSTLENGLAIVITGNKTNYTSGASVGDYVFVKNSTISGITDGLYKAATAIPYNTAIDSTYLSAITASALNKIPKIEYGIKYPSAVPTSGYTDITFNFSTVFKSPPFVMLNLQSTSTSSALGSMSACVQSVTTTSCTCRLFNDSTSERNPDLYYIAVEI